MCFGGGFSSAKQTTASKSISSSQGKKPVTGIQAIAKNIAADVKMGAATFGKGSATGSDEQKQKQIDTLISAGYTKEAALDYQKRTEGSAKTLASMDMRTEYGRDDSRPAPVSAPAVSAPAQAVDPRPQPTDTVTPTPPEAPAPIGEDASAPAAGTAEAKVVEGAKKRKGRASTIATAPSGLLTTAKTRRRRSLMGGSEPTGLIS